MMTNHGTHRSGGLPRRVAAAGMAALVVTMVAACGDSTTGSAPPSTRRTAASATADGAAPSTRPSSPSDALAVRLVDYGFQSPSSVPAGYVSLDVTDAGTQQHEMQVGRLNDGVTWDQVEERLHGPAPDSVALLVTMVGGTAPVEPGGTASTTVRLDEGLYGLFCFVVGWDGASHLAHGMAKPLEVEAPHHSAAEPASEGTIVLRDMAIDLPDGFDGTGTWKFVNEGTQPHQALVLQYADGATDAEVDAYLTATTPPAKVPALAIGGAGAISPGEEEWVHLDIPKGTTLWVCMVPDTNKGMIPHVMEGMRTTYVQT